MTNYHGRVKEAEQFRGKVYFNVHIQFKYYCGKLLNLDGNEYLIDTKNDPLADIHFSEYPRHATTIQGLVKISARSGPQQGIFSTLLRGGSVESISRSSHEQ